MTHDDLVAEVVVSEWTTEERKDHIVEALSKSYGSEPMYLNQDKKLYQEKIDLVSLAVDILNISVRDAIEEHDLSPSLLRRRIRAERKAFIKQEMGEE